MYVVIVVMDIQNEMRKVDTTIYLYIYIQVESLFTLSRADMSNL